MNHKDFKADGVIGISNTGGVEVMINESQDGVYYRFLYGGDEEPEIFEAEIIYEPDEDDPAGDFIPGFMHGEIFYPLTKCVRI